MSARRRPGSWQDEVARSFSRLFSRGSSQDKEEEGAIEEPERTDRSLGRLFFRSTSQERTDRGAQEEQERSPSRLFLRKDGKGASAENGGARGPQEEQERTRGFSRLFSRSSSQEKQEEDHNKSRAGEEDQHRHEAINSDMALDSHERLSSSETEQVNEDQSSSSPCQVTSESEDEKHTEYREKSKVLDSEKQSRENFFHFIGNLFHFTPKTSPGNAKQVDSTQDPCKEHEDVQVKNNLDKEDSHREHTQDVSTSETEQTALFSPAQTEPSVESNTEPPKETIKQEQQVTPTSGPKINGYPLEAPAVTYGTYRGSRRIRKLLKRRADVNSPIPEKEETSEKETGSTGDVGTENYHMLHEIVNMEPVSCRSSEEEMPPSKIQIKMKMQPMGQVTAQNGESYSQEIDVMKHNAEDSETDLHEDEDLKRNSEESSKVSVPTPNSESYLQEDQDLKQNAEESSLLSVPSQNNESDFQEGEDLKQNAEESSKVSVPSQNRETDVHKDQDLKQNAEESSLVSVPSQYNESNLHEDENLKQNVDVGPLVAVLNHNGESNSHESMTQMPDIISVQSVPKQNNESLSHEVEENVEDSSEIVAHVSIDNVNSSNASKEFQPNLEKNSNILEHLHSKVDRKSSCSMELVSSMLSEISSDLPQVDEKSSNISESQPDNTEGSSDNCKDLQSSFDDESHFALEMSPHTDDRANISNVYQTNSEEKLEDLQPDDMLLNAGESVQISGDVQSKGEKIPKILECLQKNSLQPNKDESPNNLHELKDSENSSDTVEGNDLDLHLLTKENTERVKMLQNVSDILNCVNLDSKENLDILEIHQGSRFENSTEISFDPRLEEIKLAVGSQSSQENMSSITEDLQTYSGHINLQKQHQSEQLNNKVYIEKPQENLDSLMSSVGTISEGTGSIESLLAGPTQEAAFNAESIFDNQHKLMKEDEHFIEVEHLKETEKLQLNPSDNRNVSEQPQPKVEDMPKITAEQPYENMHLSIEKDLQQLEEANTNVISEASAIQGENVSHTVQEIVINSDLTGKDNFQLNEQGKSMIIEKTLVNAHPNLKISIEPQTNAKRYPMIAEEQQTNVETSGGTDDDTSDIISVIDNTQGKNKSDVTPVPENVLNNGSSHVIEKVRTVSFDNGIECRSPSPTISCSPSSTDCTDIRCDSPLPLSDAIDSGMVSSQAYTPEEHIPIKILPSDIFSKSISDPFHISQEDERFGNVGSIEVEHVDNTLPVALLLDYAAKKPIEPIVEETGSQAEVNTLPSVCALYLNNGGPDVDANVSGRHLTNDIKKLNLNSDVYVAKVSVKSVNIEEVKLAPCEFRSDIISVSKVESATYDKELIRLPNVSPAEPEYDSKFKDLNSKGQQDEENIVTNTELPSDRNIKDLSVNNANPSFNEPSLFLEFNNYERSPYNCYMEAERFPSLKNIDVVENVVNMFSNDFVGDNVPQYTFLEKGLPTLPAKLPDVLKENLKNNNLRIGASDDIINVSIQTNTSESELANESLMSDDSCWELQHCDSLAESHPNNVVTHKEPVKERDVILQSTFQRDVNCTDGIHSSGSATKMSLPNTEHSVLASELFEKKASEIIFSVLHSAIDEFQDLNKNHIPNLGSVNETLVENHLFQILEGHSAGGEAEALEISSKNIQNLTTDPVISAVASRLVSDVINSSKQIMQNNLDKENGTNNGCEQASMVIANGPDEDTRQSNKKISLLDVDSSELLNSHEINSNVLLPIPTSDSDEESNDLKQTKDTEEIFNDSRHLDKEALQNGVGMQASSFSNLEAEIEDDTENKTLRFGLGLDADQGGYYSKSLETEGSMNTPFINNLLGENSRNSGTEFTDPFQFSLCDSKYVEIGSDDESTEEETGNNAQTSATDMFLTLPSRRVRIYPLSLSPIYEDDSSCEDAVSNNSSPRYKKGTATGGSSNDHTSILSLLQSVSDRLKEANMEEGNMTSLSDVAAVVSDLDNTDASGTQVDKPAPRNSNLDSTLGEKRSSLFITKAENKVNPGSGRQSFLLKSTTLSAKPSVETNPAAAENECAPSATSESSSIPNTHLSSEAGSMTALSPLQMVTDSGLSAPKPEIKCQPRMSSQSVYYQYFHSSQNLLGTENKESPTQEKVALPTEGESKETEHQTNMDSSSLKFNPRPGKVILSDVIHHENKIELKGDALDATSWVFPNGVNIRVIRGCWILYEKPHFEGQAHVLEEGEAVLLHLWDPPGAKAKPDKISIGSVKRVVKDYHPEVQIYPLEGTSDSPVYIHTEVPSLEHLVDRCPQSLTVNSGVWLTYTEPQYNGTVSVLEEGCELPQVQARGVKSMRPLKMGGLKVQLPNDPKIIIYEKPHFQGWSREITEHVSNIGKWISDGDNSDPIDVGSIRVAGGIWVGYEKDRYKGYQYLLEEGEYEDWQAWGGYSSTLQSIRYLQANFLEASVTLLETDSEDGKQVDLLNQAIPDLELAGYNTRPQCIHVKKGMWVAYQQKHYCGEQYILEKGRYKSHVDWGGSSNTIMSIRPVLLEPLGRNEVKHLIKAYKSIHFQGESVDFIQHVSDFISFMPKSFKVLRGCWLLCYHANGCDSVCVLEEGHFPDLASCGCPAPEIKYIQPIDYVFAEPSISLFALDSCEGRELHFEESVTSVLSEELNFYTQSVWVRKGLWIAFEGANFLGRQMLLDPQQIHNWSKFSGWNVIGSLRPLKQPAVYFMVRNRHRDKYLTVTGKLSDSRATFVSVSSRNGQSSQIWYFSRGFLKSKANDSCLDVIGGKNIPGSKVSLWAEHGKTRQKWKINKDGTISSYISDDLVLDVKGGNYYDQNYLIVNRAQQSALTQKWDIEIL